MFLYRPILAVALTALFLAFSFNAYACLLPIFGTSQATMGKGCADTADTSPRVFCDGFKTLGLQSSEKEAPTDLAHSLDVSQDIIKLTLKELSPSETLVDVSPPLPFVFQFTILRI